MSITLEKLDEIERGLEGVQGGPWHLDKPAVYVWAPSERGGDFPLADFNGECRAEKAVPVLRLRGWGYYTGRGSGALALHPDEAEARQRRTGEHIARLDPATVRELVSLARSARSGEAVDPDGVWVGPGPNASPPSVPTGYKLVPEEPTVSVRSLEQLAGYVSSGDYTTVRLFQDDATNEWIVKVGERLYWGASLGAALEAAFIDANIASAPPAPASQERVKALEEAVAALPGERDAVDRSLDDPAGPNNIDFDRGWNAYRKKAIRFIRALIPSEGK